MVYLPPSGPINGGGSGGGLLDRPTGVGPLCEFVPKDGGSADSKAAESETFQDFRNSLDVACEAGAAGEFGWVNWTVAANTPDLVYYQVRKNPPRSQEGANAISNLPPQFDIPGLYKRNLWDFFCRFPELQRVQPRLEDPRGGRGRAHERGRVGASRRRRLGACGCAPGGRGGGAPYGGGVGAAVRVRPESAPAPLRRAQKKLGMEI